VSHLRPRSWRPQANLPYWEWGLCDVGVWGRQLLAGGGAPSPSPSGGGGGNAAFGAPVFASSVLRKGYDTEFSTAPSQSILTDGRPLQNDTLGAGFCVTTAKMVRLHAVL
jgi:hypothetical protein